MNHSWQRKDFNKTFQEWWIWSLKPMNGLSGWKNWPVVKKMQSNGNFKTIIVDLPFYFLWLFFQNLTEWLDLPRTVFILFLILPKLFSLILFTFIRLTLMWYLWSFSLSCLLTCTVLILLFVAILNIQFAIF